MANQDTGWRPKGAMDAYKGYEVWEYNIGPHESNEGEVDGDVSLLDGDGGDDADEEDLGLDFEDRTE